MPAILEHSDLSTFAGSWPVIPSVNAGGTPTILPRTLNNKAVILGVKREDATGYDVRGRSLRLYVDSEVSYSTISFPAGSGNMTLDEVISTINGVVAGVAKRDNSFLRIESTTSGVGSYLRLATDPSSSPTDVFFNLGIFSETVSRGGEVSQALNIDPERQISLPGQKTLSEGEDIEAKNINRALFQLAVNSDRSTGLLEKKRIPVVKELDVPTLGSSDGVSLSGELVYTGPDSTPTTDELEDMVTVLDAEGREYVWEDLAVVETGTSGVAAISVDTDTGEVHIVPNGGITFAGTDPKNNYYVRITGSTSNSSINNVPLKIVSFVGAGEVVVDPQEFTIVDEGSGPTAERVTVTPKRLKVSQIQKTSVDSTRVEQLEAVKFTGVGVTRVEKNNRIFCSGATFTSGSAVAVGDLVEWSNHGITNPYSNDGVYRVTAIIDKETLELAAEDWGPVYLNSNLMGATSEVEVRTDGEFWLSPYLKFTNTGTPVAGTHIKVRYYAASTFKDSTDNPFNLIGNNLRYGQEADDTIQKAILAVLGPAVATIDEYVYNDRRITLEDLHNRLIDEHYSHDAVGPNGDTGHGGRHQDIRPDTINMFPDVDGITYTARVGSGDGGSAVKMRLRNAADDDNLFRVTADGSVYSGAGDEYIRMSPAGSLYINCETSAEPIVQVNRFHSSGDPKFIFRRAGGTVSSPSNVADTNVISQLLFSGYYSASYEDCASITVHVDGFPSSGIVPGRMVFRTADITDGNMKINMTLNTDGILELSKGLLVNVNNVDSRYLKAIDSYISKDTGTDSPVAGNFKTRIASSAAAPEAVGQNIQVDVAGGSAVNVIGVRINPGVNVGSITTRYGLKIEDQAGGSSANYAIHTGTGNIYFGGAFASSILASADDSYDIGNSTNYFKRGYFRGPLNIIHPDTVAPQTDVLNIDYTESNLSIPRAAVVKSTSPSQAVTRHESGRFEVHSTVTGTRSTSTWGIVGDATHTTSGTIDDLRTVQLFYPTVSAGTANSVAAIHIADQSGGTGGTITTSKYGIYIQASTHLGSLGTYGIFVQNNINLDNFIGQLKTVDFEVGNAMKLGDSPTTLAGLTLFEIRDTSAAYRAMTARQPTLNHGMSTVAPSTDTCFSIATNNNGGIHIYAYSGSSAHSAQLYAVGFVDDTTTGNGAIGPVYVSSTTKSGTGQTAVGDDGNIFVAANNSGARFIVKGDGDCHNKTGTWNTGTWDTEQDAVACRDLSYVMAGELDKVMQYHAPKLEEMGVLVNGFMSANKFRSLTLGAVGELYHVVDWLLKTMDLDYETVRQAIRKEQPATT